MSNKEGRILVVLVWYIAAICSVEAQSPAIEIESGGFQNARMFEAQRDMLLNPKVGLMIFNSTTDCIEMRRSDGWYDLCDNHYNNLNPNNRLFGGSEEDKSMDICETQNGGYYVLGISKSSSNGHITGVNNGLKDYWILKVGPTGVVEWDKLLGGSDEDYAMSVKETSDSGCIILGSTVSSQSGDISGVNSGSWDYWVVKLDSLGEIEWEKLYGASVSDQGSEIIQTVDGGYIAVGSWTAVFPNTNGQVMKIDSLGNEEWSSVQADAHFNSVIQTPDSGYVSCGSKSTGEYLVLKLDNTGAFVWEKTYGGAGTDKDIAQSIKMTTDGGFILAGVNRDNSLREDVWIAKLDGNGNEVWSLTNFLNGNQNAVEVLMTTDGNYVVFGHESYIWKVSSTGTTMWYKQYNSGNGSGIYMLSDGTFRCTAYTTLSKSGDVIDTSNGFFDYWVFKLDASGNVQN